MRVTRPTVSRVARVGFAAGCAVCIPATGQRGQGSPAPAPTRNAEMTRAGPSQAVPASPNRNRREGGIAQRTAAPQDWSRFGWAAGRSSAPTMPTGVTAANVASLERQQVANDGTVDAAAIYLHGARVHGGTVDVFFVTTTYGKTLAVDARGGAVLWEYTPPNYTTWAGSYRITTATPLADPDREFV